MLLMKQANPERIYFKLSRLLFIQHMYSVMLLTLGYSGEGKAWIQIQDQSNPGNNVCFPTKDSNSFLWLHIFAPHTPTRYFFGGSVDCSSWDLVNLWA